MTSGQKKRSGSVLSTHSPQGARMPECTLKGFEKILEMRD